jgi:hypothetical protein
VAGVWHGFDHPPPSSAEVKERIELYFFFLSGPSWSELTLLQEGGFRN